MLHHSDFYVWCRYFDRLMEIVIDVVLNWDRVAKKSRKRGGIFGYTKAFYAAVESQNSTGDLHAHMSVWVHGLPRSVSEYRRSCREDAFRSRLLDYVKSILQATAPATPSSVCPSCDVDALQPCEHIRAAFMKPPRGGQRPVSCACSNCNASFGADELLRSVVGKRSSSIDSCNQWLTNEAIQFANAHPKPLPVPAGSRDRASLVATLSLLVYQNHHWFHSKGCFKATRRTPKGDVCRMFFPKKRCQRTQWTRSRRGRLGRVR